jgi:hypothetical protein
MAERAGAAVVCRQCKGTGCHEYRHDYTEFVERKPRAGVLRVYQANPGIMVYTNARFGGLSYEEWRSGAAFDGAEMRQHTCPAWWYQSADYNRKPDWEQCWQANRFSDCPLFSTKHQCWERFDREGT